MNIRDIASAAHVSVATVSKVINHKDSEISNETRQRVLSVIKEYQYTPYANIQASFQTFHKQTIAFITEKNSAQFTDCLPPLSKSRVCCLSA